MTYLTPDELRQLVTDRLRQCEANLHDAKINVLFNAHNALADRAALEDVVTAMEKGIESIKTEYDAILHPPQGE